ncbi:hypothetical protein [Chitinophaga rupis]|uniref:hypothetical protein n=1 Tax=Chitinophaga rupis TaxID=573321 RepID=UPI0011606E92|nr:hypothetical protein [Chitinophaga rupis]
MKKVRFFIGFSSLLLAVAAIGATKIASANVAPEYYINTAGNCVVSPLPVCSGGAFPCQKVIPGQGTTKRQIFDTFVNTTTCADPLTQNTQP